MRLKTLVLCSSSAAILALAGTPALAQDDPATPPDPNVEAQESPADPEAGSAQTAEGADQGEEGETIVVTGLRRSLQSAQNLKRNSEQQIDAIVAEDIGKLPDIAVSDTAARIPGIQVLRERGEAGSVLLRGLDRTFYTTTYNGREIFTAETRSVALQDFPAGGIGAIEAFKTSTANLVEPGLTGLINVRSRRPFDFTGFELAGSVWGNYPKQSRDFSPNFQLLVSNRWDIGDGEVGALINFSYNRLHYRDSIRRHGFFIADLAGGRSPDWPEIRYNEADRWRPSVNGAIQWRPAPGVEFYVEGLWQGYREEVTDRMWAQPLWGGSSYANITRDGNKVLSGTVNRPTGCCGNPMETWGFQGATKRHTDTYQYAGGGSWDAGSLRVSGDLAMTRSKFKLRTESVDYEINTNNFSVDWFTGPIGGPGPTFQVRGIDPSNPALYNFRGFFEDYANPAGSDFQARLDFEWESGISVIPRVQWGARFVDRDADDRAGAFFWNGHGRGVPISAVPLEYVLAPRGFRGDNNPPFPMQWLAPTFDSVWGNLTQLRQFAINLTGVGSVNGPPIDPGRSFEVNEKSYAAYGQVQYEFPLGGEAVIDGAIGMRVVKTETDTSGNITAPPRPPFPVSFQNEYTDWLPNANMRVRFTPELQLRLAFTETRTRPTFQQLNPALRLAQPPVCNPGVRCVRTGSGGNPFLEPLESTNYDASLEYYFSRNGFASVAAFRRNMKGFILTQTVVLPELDPESGAELEITAPINSERGRIQGVEAQLSTFFDFGGLPDFLRNFGIQANATYIDAKTDQATPGGIRRLRLPDVSKWTYNLVAMYEGGGLSARLAYNRRTGFPEGALSLRGDYTLQGRGHPISRLDWSSSYAFNDNFTVFFDVTNILGKPFKSDIVRVNYNTGTGAVTGGEEFPMIVRYDETVFTGGVRFRF
ncbi:MAG TPA: TonB-dependent receptor [Allosphingosinicella sp.]|nr:TonB-dependent receptor [Allosphingosinicella sp.]